MLCIYAQAEAESVVQYLENNDNVSELHAQIEECDSVLARMQDMLLVFQGDLGGISEEIRHLQDESLSMNIRLKNRRSAESLLHEFLDHASIDAELAASITSGPVNEEFLDCVVDMTKKLKYLNQEMPRTGVETALNIAPRDTFAAKTLLPELDKLKARAIAKTREYFATQFNALRKTKTNIQILQQNSLVKYAQLLQFLQQEAPPIADEIRAMYIDSMGRTLYNLFRNYNIQLQKLDLVIATKYHLVAVEEAALRSLFTQKVDSTKKTDAFSLSDREKILDAIEVPPILVHVATAEHQRYPYEALLRSVIKHLSDATTSEFLFIVDFFKSGARETYNRIFGRTLSMLLEALENYLLNCYDAIGLLLMIKITHAQRLVMQRRRIPVLDPFFDRLSMLLWPRFKTVLDLNLKSIKTVNHRKLGVVDMTPHYISRRYAEFVSSILVLHGGSDGSMGVGGGGEHMLLQDVQSMRVEMVALLDRMSSLLTTTKDKKVFLINNFDQILGVFQDRHVSSEEVQIFEQMLLQQREFFAEECLKSAFPKLLSFVVASEQALSAATGPHRGAGPHPAIDAVQAEALVCSLHVFAVYYLRLIVALRLMQVREFSTSWRNGIQHINDDVLAYFANFRNGMEILKQVLTQLLLYYTRLQDIIKRGWGRPPPFVKDVVSTATILMEIKRYSRAF